MHASSKRWLLGAVVLGVGCGAPQDAAATGRLAASKPSPKVVARSKATKGQVQVAGANGQFGTVYTLKNGFNFEILSSRYSIDPFLAYELTVPHTDQKLVVCDIALKNAIAVDHFFNSSGMFTFVDSTGQLITTGNVSLESRGEQSFESTLKPGQGLGQPGLKNPLRVGVALPAKARIVKIIVNVGLAGSNENVIRYYIAGATKAEAGEAGNPRNVIAPLPDSVRDPVDTSGATALDEGKGVVGTYFPSGFFDIRLDVFAYSTDPVRGGAPGNGNRFAIATVTVKSLTDKTREIFDVEGGDYPIYQLTDSDGEKYKPQYYVKARRDEDAQYSFTKGDEYTFRVVFKIPKDAAAKKLILATGQSRKWAYDVSAVK